LFEVPGASVKGEKNRRVHQRRERERGRGSSEENREVEKVGSA